MRKLMSKKGFTLVELMIVIVIMGILVAVAIPVYGAVTKNAEKKTCISNMRDMKSTASTWQMQGNDGDQVKITGSSVITAEPTYTAMFEGGTLPKCPSSDDNTYTVTITNNNPGYTVAVTCTVEGHVLSTGTTDTP